MAYGKISTKQREILEYIKQEILNKGYPPAVREICEAVDLKSTSSVHSHLETLEKNGYIRRTHTADTGSLPHISRTNTVQLFLCFRTKTGNFHIIYLLGQSFLLQSAHLCNIGLLSANIPFIFQFYLYIFENSIGIIGPLGIKG